MSLLDRLFPPKKPAATLAKQDNAPATVTADGATVGARPLVNPAISGGYTPEKIANILENAERGDEYSIQEYFKLADRVVERELHSAGILNALALAVSGLHHKVEPPRGDTSRRARKIADDIQQYLEPGSALRLVAPAIISQGISHGLGAASVVWNATATNWTPAGFLHKPSHFFTFSRQDASTPMLRNSLAGQAPLPLEPGLFLAFTPRRNSAIQLKNGLAWALCWTYVIKSITLANEAAFIEAFGHPVVVGKHGRGATPADVSLLNRAVSAIQGGGRAVYRDDLEIEFKEIARTSTDIYEKLCRYLDEQVSKFVWGNTLSTDGQGSGTYALGKVHAENKYDTIRSYGHQWAACLQQQFVTAYVAWNYGPDAPVPRVIVDVEESEDLVSGSQIVKNLTDAGVQLDAGEIRERFGFRNPEPGAEVVGVRTALPAMQSRQAAGCPVHSPQSAQAGEPPRDELDDLADQMLADYQPLSDEIDRQLATAAQGATSAEELRSAVQALLENLDTAELQRLFASARVKARLTGDLGGDI